MDNRFDYNSYYNSTGLGVPRKRRKGLTYIALVLVTSFISSMVVGGALYSKFSKDLEKATLASLNAISLSESTASFSGSNPSDFELARQFKNEGMAGVESMSVMPEGMEKQAMNLATGYDVTTIAKKAGPSIVGIRMTIRGTRQNYFGGSNSQTAEGSGIIISKDGYIMTNYHVVSGADPKSGISSRTVLEVFLPDGREAKATFKGGDSKTDLAAIKIDLNNLPVAEIGDSSKLEVGELAVAIGNPLGMEFAGSVTVGVISALNRTVVIQDKTMNLIQTDAAINSGNSGGALLNSQGKVIGVNSVKIAASGVEGLGFAIPMNDAWPVVDQLIKYGYVRGRPFIGISGSEISETLSRAYNLPKGIYITDITAGSGAANAGLKAEDVLIGIDGKTVETMRDLDKIKESYKPGDTVTVRVARGNARIDLRLTFGEEK